MMSGQFFFPRSKSAMAFASYFSLPDGQPGYNAPIDARYNWWGSESTGYVNGKIWDKLDNESLVAVDYMPVKINNQSLIYGKCFAKDIENTYRRVSAILSQVPIQSALT